MFPFSSFSSWMSLSFSLLSPPQPQPLPSLRENGAQRRIRWLVFLIYTYLWFRLLLERDQESFSSMTNLRVHYELKRINIEDHLCSLLFACFCPCIVAGEIYTRLHDEVGINQDSSFNRNLIKRFSLFASHHFASTGSYEWHMCDALLNTFCVTLYPLYIRPSCSICAPKRYNDSIFYIFK